MMKLQSKLFHLKVQKIEQICLFDLSWGQGQTLTVQVDYPACLTQLYEDWRFAYLQFYQSDHLRGRAIKGGVAEIVVDWHAELVRAETKLMYEFHRWLRSTELYEIRARIASASQDAAQANPLSTQPPPPPPPIQLFLTCASIDLDRFPWEAWELEFAATGTIQIIRAPLNISDAVQTSPRTGKPRILAILGDDTGLDFKADQEAVRSLRRLAEIQFVGWQPTLTAAQVIGQITSAIADPLGWDVLFFAGHSNETALTGGELSIAPGVSISIHEIKPQLIAAKKRGLKVAIFNSCSGLSIADSLVDLGFGQVVVMREPIHNRVAQEFLIHFLHGLSKRLDVYEAILSARQFLRMEKSHTYPSASLVPSLFCHPGAPLFRLKARPWRDRARKLLPTRLEAIALSIGVVLSVLAPVQNLLRDNRLDAQARYRSITAQIPANQPPPVALIQMDTDSFKKAGVEDFQPLDRAYLALILDRLVQLKAETIGFDVLLDSPKSSRNGDRKLGASVRKAVEQNRWLVFGSIVKSDQEIGVSEKAHITRSNWTMQGVLNANPLFMKLPDQSCPERCPIDYLLALLQSGREASRLPSPRVEASSVDRGLDLREQLLKTLKQAPPKTKAATLLNWSPPFDIQPFIDFSLPPTVAYQLIPAWQLLDTSYQFPQISKQVVLVAPGSDERLGMGDKPDRFTPPAALAFWQPQQSWLTGGESHAYMIHHWLRHHLITPIPDLWMVGAAIVLGKAIAMGIAARSLQWNQARKLQAMAGLSGLVALYGLISLQLYISMFVLLPWLLPSAVFLAYVLPATRRNQNV